MCKKITIELHTKLDRVCISKIIKIKAEKEICLIETQCGKEYTSIKNFKHYFKIIREKGGNFVITRKGTAINGDLVASLIKKERKIIMINQTEVIVVKERWPFVKKYLESL